MNDLRHYAGELEQMQSLPLEIKIRMTKMRIQQWVYAFSGEAYISFSGGKDSTVLLNIAREVFPNLPAVFCDTGLEYPEIREFVKRFEKCGLAETTDELPSGDPEIRLSFDFQISCKHLAGWTRTGFLPVEKATWGSVPEKRKAFQIQLCEVAISIRCTFQGF